MSALKNADQALIFDEDLSRVWAMVLVDLERQLTHSYSEGAPRVGLDR